MIIKSNEVAIGYDFTGVPVKVVLERLPLVFDTECAFIFWFALYPAEEISRRFEFTEKVLEKRWRATASLERFAELTRYSVPYFIARIKSTVVKLCSQKNASLNTLDAVVKYVESGNFNIYSTTQIVDAVKRTGMYSMHAFIFTWSERFMPNFQADFYKLIIDTPDAFDETPDIIIAPDPTVVTPETIPASTTTGTSSASFGKYALPLLGVGIAFALFNRKK